LHLLCSRLAFLDQQRLLCSAAVDQPPRVRRKAFFRFVPCRYVCAHAHYCPVRAVLIRVCCSHPAVLYRRVWVELGAGPAGDKHFFLRVTDRRPSAREIGISKKFNVTETLWYKGLATFSSGGVTAD